MSLLCRIGLHRLEWRAYRRNEEIVDECRCTRPCCPRYSEWTFTNAEYDITAIRIRRHSMKEDVDGN